MSNGKIKRLNRSMDVRTPNCGMRIPITEYVGKSKLNKRRTCKSSQRKSKYSNEAVSINLNNRFNEEVHQKSVTIFYIYFRLEDRIKRNHIMVKMIFPKRNS